MNFESADLSGFKLFGEYFHYEVRKVTLFSLFGIIIIIISIFWSKYAKEKSLGQDL